MKSNIITLYYFFIKLLCKLDIEYFKNIIEDRENDLLVLNILLTKAESIVLNEIWCLVSEKSEISCWLHDIKSIKDIKKNLQFVQLMISAYDFVDIVSNIECKCKLDLSEYLYVDLMVLTIDDFIVFIKKEVKQKYYGK